MFDRGANMRRLSCGAKQRRAASPNHNPGLSAPRASAYGGHGHNRTRSSDGTAQSSIGPPKFVRMSAWEELGAPASSQTTLEMSFSGNRDDTRRHAA